MRCHEESSIISGLVGCYEPQITALVQSPQTLEPNPHLIDSVRLRVDAMVLTFSNIDARF